MTTNEKWETAFVNRINKEVPMMKLFKLIELDINWRYENVVN